MKKGIIAIMFFFFVSGITSCAYKTCATYTNNDAPVQKVTVVTADEDC